MSDLHDELEERAVKVRSEMNLREHHAEVMYLLGLAHGLEEAASLALRRRVDDALT